MKKRSIQQLLFPFFVAVLSLIGVLRNFEDFNLLSLLVSIMGAIAVILFIKNNRKASKVFFFWIIVQLISFRVGSFTYLTNQLPEIILGINSKGSRSFFSINFLPIFYLLGYRVMKRYELVGKQVSILPIKENAAFTKIEGEIVEIMPIKDDGKWLKVQFFNEGDSEPRFVMIKPKGQEQFSHKNAIVAFVHESGDMSAFIDWGSVKLM